MRSLQIHPPLSPPHALITVHQPPSKTRRRRNVMTTPADPPVAAPGDDDDASRSILPVCESMRGVGGAKLSESARMWVSGHAVRVFISDPS